MTSKLPETSTLTDQPKLESNATTTRFVGQVVVVSGGGGAIGSAAVLRFLNDGASVAMVDQNEQRCNEVLKEIENLMPTLMEKPKVYACDVSKRDDCFKTVDKIASDFGKINHLINAVAYFGLNGQGLDATEEDWHKTMSVNVAGYSFMAQACFQHMKKISKTENCSIVNTASISAHQAQKDRWTYCASKAAIIQMTRNMALDMASEGVRVNSVSPGCIWTPVFNATWPGVSRLVFESVFGKYHLVNRMGEIAEVAGAYSFLCSKDASFINASDLKVDGGYGAMSAEGFGEETYGNALAALQVKD